MPFETVQPIPNLELPQEPRPAPIRLFISESIYHQAPGSPPVSLQAKFERILHSTEQPYSRQLKATQEWRPLPKGWEDAQAAFETPALIALRNDEGGDFTRYPTKEEKEAVQARVLELAYEHDLAHPWEIPPQESFRGKPPSLSKLRIRCRSGEAKFTLLLIPS